MKIHISPLSIGFKKESEKDSERLDKELALLLRKGLRKARK